MGTRVTFFYLSFIKIISLQGPFLEPAKCYLLKQYSSMPEPKNFSKYNNNQTMPGFLELRGELFSYQLVFHDEASRVTLLKISFYAVFLVEFS